MPNRKTQKKNKRDRWIVKHRPYNRKEWSEMSTDEKCEALDNGSYKQVIKF